MSKTKIDTEHLRLKDAAIAASREAINHMCEFGKLGDHDFNKWWNVMRALSVYENPALAHHEMG